MMRLSLVLALAVGIAAAPAAAQEGNQANAADTVVTEPEATLDNVGEPALPEVSEPIVAEDIALEPVAMPATRPRDDDDGFPWGLIGLVGLVGLLGRARS